MPFEIPDTWQWVKLGYISTYEQTKEKIKANLAEPNLWELNLEDIEKGGRILQKKTVQQCNSKGDKTIFKKGDILYSKLRPYLLKILIADEAGICTSEIVPFHTYNEISSDYMVSVLKSPFIDNYINSVTYGVKMPRAGTDTMINLFIPLPPVKEQNRIIECIHSLNPLIQKYQKVEEQLYELNSNIKEQLKKSILQYAIEGKLVPQNPNDEPTSALLERIRKEKQKLIAVGKIKKDKNESIIYRRDNSYYEKQNGIEKCIDDEIPFEIPDTWEWCRFNQLFKLTSGQDLSTDKFNSACKGIPYITGASNLENGSVIINRWTTEPKSFSYSGDLLLTCKGTIGKIAFLTVEKAHIARQIMSIASPYKINLHFIKLILNLNIINLKAKAKSMIPGISRDDVLSILIPVPPLNEQDRIVLKLQELEL